MPVRNRVQEERMKQGLTQHDLATRARCSRMSIAYIESGRMEPGGELMLKIAHALEKPVENLFEVVEETRLEQALRVGKKFARDLPRQMVVVFVCMVLFFQGGAIAADRVSPSYAAALHVMTQLLTQPERIVEEASALGVTPAQILDVDKSATFSATRGVIRTSCGAWLSKYSALAQRPDPDDAFAKALAEHAAACFDVIGLSGDAVAAHHQVIQLANFTAQSDGSSLHFVNGLRLFFEATHAQGLGDSSAAGVLLREAIAADPTLLYLVANGAVQDLNDHRAIGKLLPQKELLAEVHLARAVSLLRGAQRQPNTAAGASAREEARWARRAWPGIVESVEAWDESTIVGKPSLKATALLALGAER